MQVKDLKTELESTKQMGKENLEQALSIEKERCTQVQWDMQEVRRKCMEMELRLKADQVRFLCKTFFPSPFSGELGLIVSAISQDEKAYAEETKASTIKENEALRIELDSSREQLNNLQKCREEADLKSKSDVKLLVREVKLLRSSQSEMRQELDRVSKEKVEIEVIVHLVILLFLVFCFF